MLAITTANRETFAALLLGHRELLANKLVMDAYTRFGGERIREYDREIRPPVDPTK